MKTETVNTTELKIGDVVHFKGGRFELVECTCDAERAAYNANHAMHNNDMEGSISLRAFRGKLISPRDECSIPDSYFNIGAHGMGHYWTFQGNHRAIWTREV